MSGILTEVINDQGRRQAELRDALEERDAEIAILKMRVERYERVLNEIVADGTSEDGINVGGAEGYYADKTAKALNEELAL